MGRCGVARCWSPTSAGFERVGSPARRRRCPAASRRSASRGGWPPCGRCTQGSIPAPVLPQIDLTTLERSRRARGDRSDAVTTTSAGRLFDAVAVLLGGRTHVTYEAQAAIELEALARTVPRQPTRRSTKSTGAPLTTARARSRRRSSPLSSRTVRAGCRPRRARRRVPRVVRPRRLRLAARAASDYGSSTRSC